mmetsp:Transcript_36886/g.77879  ORF Transcript_36886/g.77879 Transcript_36886/m.77879 type:complete len:362 (-) Transcript_36886:653-1738(-)
MLAGSRTQVRVGTPAANLRLRRRLRSVPRVRSPPHGERTVEHSPRPAPRLGRGALRAPHAVDAPIPGGVQQFLHLGPMFPRLGHRGGGGVPQGGSSREIDGGGASGEGGRFHGRFSHGGFHGRASGGRFGRAGCAGFALSHGRFRLGRLWRGRLFAFSLHSLRLCGGVRCFEFGHALCKPCVNFIVAVAVIIAILLHQHLLCPFLQLVIRSPQQLNHLNVSPIRGNVQRCPSLQIPLAQIQRGPRPSITFHFRDDKMLQQILHHLPIPRMTRGMQHGKPIGQSQTPRHIRAPRRNQLVGILLVQQFVQLFDIFRGHGLAIGAELREDGFPVLSLLGGFGRSRAEGEEGVFVFPCEGGSRGG